MRCKIADLIVEVPDTGGLSHCCLDYLYDGHQPTDVVIDDSQYRTKRYSEQLGYDGIAYMESSFQFYLELLKHNGFYLHSSAIVVDDKAYLFSGPSGVGKSTHTRLWQQLLGDAAQIINDDKPALRLLDHRWFAYGTPWCGKDHINQNKKVPLAGICFLKQAEETRIRQLSPQEAITKTMSQTIHRVSKLENLDLLLGHLSRLVQMIPVFELENLPNLDAAALSYETMHRRAEENGL